MLGAKTHLMTADTDGRMVLHEAMAALKEVFVLYSSNVWGDVSNAPGFEKRGQVSVLEDGTATHFRVKLAHESVLYTFVHQFSQTRANTVQIHFQPSELNPIQHGKYSVRIIEDAVPIFHGGGTYSCGVQQILQRFI